MLGTRHYPRSQVVSRLDQRDASLALHFPFWYQYSDMTGSTIYSYDRNRHTGTVTGATWGYQGRTFNGVNDVITAPDSAALDLTTAITAQVWVKETTSKANYAFLSKAVSSPADVNYQFGIYANEICIYYYGLSGVGEHLYRIPQDLTTGIWTNVAVSFTYGTAASAKLLVNGVEVAGTWSIGTGNGIPAGNTGVLEMAHSSLGISVNYAAIVLGDILLYNRTLTQAEVTNNYQVTRWRYI